VVLEEKLRQFGWLRNIGWKGNPERAGLIEKPPIFG
jgi:hypothetical protein